MGEELKKVVEFKSRAGRLDLTDSPEPVLTDSHPSSFSSLPKRESAAVGTYRNG